MTTITSIDGQYRDPWGETVRLPAAFHFIDRRPERVRSRKPTGRLPCKPYSMSSVIHRPIYGECNGRGPFQGLTWSGHLNKIPYSDGFAASSALRSKAEINALLKIKQQRVNYGVALAEAKETAGFVGDAAKKIASAYKKLANLDPKGAARALGFSKAGNIPQRWVELQYGLNPLLADVHGSINNLIDRPSFEWAIRVEGRSVQDSETTTSVTAGVHPGTVRTAVKEECRVVLYYEPQSAALASIASLGFSNPLEVVWERAPLSLVVDWFVPFGDWLSTLDAAVGYRFVDGCRTQVMRQTGSWFPNPSGPRSSWSGPSPSGRAEVFYMVRNVYDSSPVPTFPRPEMGLSVGRLANGLSMLTQVFARHGFMHRRLSDLGYADWNTYTE